jgi:hypothetical protein
MPRWAIYALPDRLKAERYEDIPTPRNITVALARGRLPWVERDGLGRYFFNDTDLSKIAGALGLKPPAQADQPAGATPASPIDKILANLDKLF